MTTVTPVTAGSGHGRDRKHETVLRDLVEENARLKSDLAVLRDQLQENFDVVGPCSNLWTCGAL